MNTPPRFRWCAVAILGLATLSVPASSSAAEAKATVTTMESLARAYDDAYNRRDARALAALYLDDAQILAPNLEIVRGRLAIEEFWRSELAASTLRQTSKVLEVEDHGGVAFEAGSWLMRHPEDGAAGTGGKYLVVWKKSGGQWKIHRETWNTDDPVAGSSAVPADLDETRKAYDRAWLNQDGAAFDRLLADDFVQIDPEGKVLSRAEVMANARSGEVKFEVGKSEDPKVRMYGLTAVVSSRWSEKSTSKGKTTEAVMQNIVVYARVQGRWRVVSDQVTPITPETP